MAISLRQTELLAPAGGIDSFFAALEAGADAVYCGLDEFSARAKAKNFTLAEVERLTAYCRQHERKLYVALNTLIKEAELPRLIEVLSGLEEIGIDGVILQDVGVWRMIRNHFPGLPLHASTQMTVHNAAGVTMLEQMGFSRAVLARELSLSEIGAIRAKTTIELEHFVHGALCFGISGQCFFSSYLNGTSGNRGRCAQPCRRLYQHQGRAGYYFSTNDFCAIEFLPQLIEAGVVSFKIEGRMKSAEYVGRVVAAYRLMLDAAPSRRTEALAEARELLALSFGRPASTGFLTGKAAPDIAVSSRQGTIGSLLGKIATVRRDGISFVSNGRLHLGDRVRILPQNDQAGSGFTVTALMAGKRKVKVVRAGEFVTIPVTGKNPFQVGDSIYRVSAGDGTFPSVEACRKKLAAVRLASIGVRLQVGLAGNVLDVAAEGDGIVFRESYQVESFAATKSPLSEETLRRVFAKSGDTPFLLESLTAVGLPEVVIPPSRLNEIRRDFYQRMQVVFAEERGRRRRDRFARAADGLLPPGAVPPGESSCLSVTVGGVDEIALLAEADVDEVVLLLDPANVHALPGEARNGLVWDLPGIIFDGQWPEYVSLLRKLREQGYRKFRVNNLGHFAFFEKDADVELVAGARLYTLNTFAALAWRELGVAALTLSLEDDRKNIADLLARDTGVPVTVTVFAPVELLQSRIPLRGIAGGDFVQTASGEDFQVTIERGLTVLVGGEDFSLAGRLKSLREMGANKWHLDLRRCGAFSECGRAVLAAVRSDRGLSQTTLFNFERGLA